MRARAFATPTLLPLVLLAGCERQPVVDPGAEREALLEADRAFSALSEQEGPAEAFRTYLSDDAVMLPSGGPALTTRAAIEDSFEGAAFGLVWEPQDGGVSGDGTMGWTWGTYLLTARGAEGPIEIAGKYLNVWEKDETGGWRVRADIGNQGPAPPPTPPEP